MDTINRIEIAFDPNKNAINTSKHGVALAEGANLEWDEAVTWQDARRNYGEVRMCAIAYIGHRLYHVVYVDRACVRRIISLRKANLKEVKRYAET